MKPLYLLYKLFNGLQRKHRPFTVEVPDTLKSVKMFGLYSHWSMGAYRLRNERTGFVSFCFFLNAQVSKKNG